ncbi:hypothetical protein A2130_03480 [Candidatus Woesebacteria bacterium GWC2_33_12]|uniref:Uncharacterized protein n=1 Tax=Candidatus Woesebacteria bacterium GW2011_GWB1_33_22 TaxID=1618566 RepID=A0A0G0C2Q7_9BACT|nr:MAG: hypothetical protein UR29_C0001G0015 [Candidatus Woesebacteria bacterium GW2011_GWC2_33_12]KKP42775.1 MAG: hypothetical protein UR33_C0001G0136 [Candidatus Woesebacteria bacterium GW2011_GWA2_33_20]KKP45450.1 MAG: hypothetical protein UR35_C0001G0047 [Candidatus Woesebacteria bacterium GW2011_GWB1_33_22]KKP47322.1 MAG: hypothetical protein UR37_C0001G0015 [Microgenomates group bacterium GW2011_GWC1_33_28]KKP51068.1 MAG: hypothetical protein UR41_C0001G0015 [Candidatus Woesebacteria bact
MNYYQTKSTLLHGSNYKEIKKNSDKLFASLQKQTKRQPYVRSAYFSKQKIFFNLFWIHLFDKPDKIRSERLRFLKCGIELIQKSRNHPESKDNLNNKAEILHRFMGITKNKIKFAVQIKEIKRTGKKYLMSVFLYD